MLRQHRWRWALIVSVVAACSGTTDDTEPYSAVEFGTGNPVSVDQYAGRPVLLAGWATWCVPCERELPELDAYVDERTDDDLVVVAVNVDKATVGDDDVDAMLSRLDVSLRVWRDTDARLPFSVLLDRDGEVSNTWVGALDVDDDEFIEAIAAVTN